MKPEILFSETLLPTGEQQVSLAVQTLGGVFEKRFNVLPEVFNNEAAYRRALLFFEQQILVDLKHLRDQLNEWEL